MEWLEGMSAMFVGALAGTSIVRLVWPDVRRADVKKIEDTVREMDRARIAMRMELLGRMDVSRNASIIAEKSLRDGLESLRDGLESLRAKVDALAARADEAERTGDLAASLGARLINIRNDVERTARGLADLRRALGEDA